MERVVESARVAQAGGFDDEAVGFGASEELGDRDGERRGDGAAEAFAEYQRGQQELSVMLMLRWLHVV